MRQIKKARCTRPSCSTGGAVLALALSGLAAGSASAEEWRLTPRLTVEEAYNSNIDLAAKGREESDFVTSISPGASVRGSGRRLSLNFDYDPQQVFFLHNSDRSELRQRFRGLTSAELLEQLLFFEASGSVNQQFTSNTGAVGGTTLTASNNLSTVQTYSLGPVLRNHLGTFADTELRYTYSAVMVDGDDVSDTTTNGLSFLMRSGRDFSQLAWTFNASASEAERNGGAGSFDDTKTERKLAKIDTQYALSSTFSLLTGLGFEEIEDPTLNDPPSGEIWDVGFQYRPNSVSSARFTAGERFGGGNYNVDVDYRPSPVTRFRVGYVQQINTSQGLAVQNLGSLGVSQSGTLIDSTTGRPFLPGDPRFGVTNAAFRQDRFTIGFETSGLRNQYTVEIFDEKREFDTQASDNTHSRGIILGFNRSMTPLLTLDLGASYSRSEFENLGDREDEYYTATSGLSYRLSDDADARFNYRYTDRRSTTPNSDIIENVVTLTLVKSF
jgi:uncharacterized protein (PEP-CTERM system associated)